MCFCLMYWWWLWGVKYYKYLPTSTFSIRNIRKEGRKNPFWFRTLAFSPIVNEATECPIRGRCPRFIESAVLKVQKLRGSVHLFQKCRQICRPSLENWPGSSLPSSDLEVNLPALPCINTLECQPATLCSLLSLSSWVDVSLLSIFEPQSQLRSNCPVVNKIGLQHWLVSRFYTASSLSDICSDQHFGVWRMVHWYIQSQESEGEWGEAMRS